MCKEEENLGKTNFFYSFFLPANRLFNTLPETIYCMEARQDDSRMGEHFKLFRHICLFSGGVNSQCERFVLSIR